MLFFLFFFFFFFFFFFNDTATTEIYTLSLHDALPIFPPQRVIGSGTILDTARFRYLLSEYFHVDARSIHGAIIGEHGDSEVPVWSLANVAGMKLRDLCASRGIEYDVRAMDELFRQTREAAFEIIQRKGATYYAVAAGIMRLTEAILRNQNTVLSVSSLVQDFYGI